MARIDAAYNYFLTTYGQSIGSRYESHKKSELRETYNKIIQSNKESPLYKITEPENASQLAIDIKEHSNDMAVAVSKLTSGGDDISAILNKKIAFSSSPEYVTADFVGNDNDEVASFNIDILSLASPQINTGNYLHPLGHDFEQGSYSFNLETRNNTYEFQYNVSADDTNSMVQNKILRLINSSDLGLVAEIDTDKKKNNALVITSKATGLNENEEYIFKITTDSNYRELAALGIDYVSSSASNSSFTLNGNPHESMSNTFTVNRAFEITIKKPTIEAASIGIMADTEALSDGINNLIHSYNGMIEVGLKASMRSANNKLYNDVTKVSRSMESSLNEIGISADEVGRLELDSQVLSEKINSDDRDNTFSTLNKFRNSIKNLSSRTSINPMNYLDKVVVEYKNPNKTHVYPYASSQYSGMLLDYGL